MDLIGLPTTKYLLDTTGWGKACGGVKGPALERVWVHT